MNPALHAPPSLTLAGLEPLRATLELTHALRTRVPKLPRGQGEPVVVVPGFGATPHMTWLLRRRLTALGYDVHDWGMGLNLGPGAWPHLHWMEPLIALVRKLSEKHGRKVTLIGWSLGGVLSRELAKGHPELVAKVITMGTPVQSFNTGTNAKWLYQLVHGKGVELPPNEEHALSAEPTVPTVALFSKCDGVVSWKACHQRDAQRTRHVEIPGASHIGMTVNVRVLKALAYELSTESAV